MTLDTWRKGSGARDPLPVQVKPHGKVNRITVSEESLLDWLLRYRPDLRRKWLKLD